jgi:hypothetical protein
MARMRDAARFDWLRVRNHIDHHEVSTAITRGAQQEVDGRKRQISEGGGLRPPVQRRRVGSSRVSSSLVASRSSSSSSRVMSTETSS